MPSGKLDNEQRVFVVQALAMFDTPNEVLKELKEAYGVEIKKQSVEAYDPTKRAGQNLDERWRELFWSTRKAFLEDTAAIGISHRVVRLRKLQRLVDENSDPETVAQLLEQAAKEMGNAYTNKHRLEHTGKDGGPIETMDLSKLTGEELEQLERIFSPLARSGDDAGPDQGGEKPQAG